MPETKKKILMISFRCPWPQEKGGYNLRFLNIAKILNKSFQVDLLTLIEDRQEEKYTGELKKIFENVIYFYHPKVNEYFNSFKSIFSLKPLQSGYFYSPRMANWLNKNYKNYDLIFCSTIRTVEYVKKIDVKKCLDFVDAISLNYHEAKENTKGLWKLIYSIENKRLLRYERKATEYFDLAFITTKKDKNFIFKNENAKVVILQNGVKGELLQRNFKEQEENWLTFLGKMDYQPNEDACLFFANKVFPKIKSKHSEIEFYIVGINPTKKILNLQKTKGVIVTGKVKDPYSYLERSKLVVAPLRFGGGMQNKILEGMALSKTVLTTPIGAAGITEAKDGKHLIIADHKDPEEMAEKINWLLNTEDVRKKIGENARTLILENYTWERVEKILLKFINNYNNE